METLTLETLITRGAVILAETHDPMLASALHLLCKHDPRRPLTPMEQKAAHLIETLEAARLTYRGL